MFIVYCEPINVQISLIPLNHGHYMKFEMVCSCQQSWDHSEHFPTCSMNACTFHTTTIVGEFSFHEKRGLRLMYFANNFC